jgi:hypothetical protein
MKKKMRIHWFLTTMLGIAFNAQASGAAQPKAVDCDRQCLAKILDTYFDSIAKHDASELKVSGKVRFTENGADLKVGQGLWQRGGPATYRLDAIDPEDGQVASNAVITDTGNKAILLVRMKVEKRKVTEVETLVVLPREGQRSNPDSLSGTTPTVYATVVPEADRGTRQQLVAAAAAYLDALATRGTDSFKAPPIAPEAIRAENGVQTTGISRGGRAPVSLAESFNNPVPRPAAGAGVRSFISGRRFPVADLEHGIVLVIGEMNLHLPPGQLDGPPLHAVPKPDGVRLQVLSEFFKISGGQIHQIQAVMLDLDDPKVTTPGWSTGQ